MRKNIRYIVTSSAQTAAANYDFKCDLLMGFAIISLLSAYHFSNLSMPMRPPTIKNYNMGNGKNKTKKLKNKNTKPQKTKIKHIVKNNKNGKCKPQKNIITCLTIYLKTTTRFVNKPSGYLNFAAIL